LVWKNYVVIIGIKEKVSRLESLVKYLKYNRKIQDWKSVVCVPLKLCLNELKTKIPWHITISSAFEKVPGTVGSQLKLVIC